MASNRLAFAALGVACVTAAGGGSYLATRQNVASVALPVSGAALAAWPAEEPRTLPDNAVTPEPAAPKAQRTVTQAPDLAPKRRAIPAAPPRRAPAPHQEPLIGAGLQTQAAERALPGPAGGPATAGLPSSATSTDPQPSAPPVDERAADVPRVFEPPSRAFQELVVSADSVIGLQTEGLLSSERARVEDSVEAHVVRDVRVGGEVAIPAGTRALGSVVVVERGGKLRDRARLGIRFQTLVFADGTRTPITTETIYRLGEPPSNGSAARIGGGGAVGAILGAIIGGGKGAAIGASTGASAGTAAVMSGERKAAILPPGSEVTARILSPVTVTIERE